LAAPSDSPLDPETGRVVDPEVLAERRARRAEPVERGELERAAHPERTVTNLEQRLHEAESRLAAAQHERRALASGLEHAERELTAAQQREFAEQRLRIELEGDAGSALRDLEEELAQLRAEHRRAEARAAELTRALDTARRERSAREQAVRRSASERDQAVAEATQLQAELDHRAAEHDAVGVRVGELREALETARSRPDAVGAEGSGAPAGTSAGHELLRDALRTVEEEQRRDAARLEQAREELAARERELRAAAGLLAAREGELRVLREEAGARHEAEAAARSARARAVELGYELEEERAQRAALEAFVEAERARWAAELAQAAQALDAAEAASSGLAAELARQPSGEAQMRAALAALGEELEAVRREGAIGEQHEAAVGRLVADLIRIAGHLREDFERVLEELTAERDAQRDAFAAELAANEAEHAAAAEHAGAAVDELRAELRRERAAGTGNPIYDAPPSGPLVPRADHPALARPAGAADREGAEPPAVVVDLTRAMERLRAAGEQRSLRLVADRDEVPDEGLTAQPALDADARAEPGTAAAVAAPLAAPAPPSLGDAGPILPATVSVTPTTQQAWFAPALVGLAAVDVASAERLLVAALPVQADLVGKGVAYALELAVTGYHHVSVERRGAVVVSSGERKEAEFVLAGPVELLVPLAAGGARRRLRGVAVRGRRRRLRRLLRALERPIGLPDLQAADVRPRPGDLLALLCLRVPVDSVLGADFSVAYVVTDAEGRRVRTLVRAEPDGSLVAIPEAPDAFAADATVTVDADGLLGALGGTAPVAPQGDVQAVATLQRWLRDVQGLPA